MKWLPGSASKKGHKKKAKPCDLAFRDSAGTRTQDPYIKSVLLYQLSYEIPAINELSFKNGTQK